jgi:hypothetical protein
VVSGRLKPHRGASPSPNAVKDYSAQEMQIANCKMQIENCKLQNRNAALQRPFSLRRASRHSFVRERRRPAFGALAFAVTMDYSFCNFHFAICNLQSGKGNCLFIGNWVLGADISALRNPAKTRK